MNWLILGLLAFCLLSILVHLATIGIAILRCRPVRNRVATGSPAVTIIRPVCGLDNFAGETLRSTFLLDYPHAELLFCVARADDAAVPFIRRLIAEYPGHDARLLIGDERISGNPKLNNLFKGWREARHGWIVMADSNVLMPRHYVQRLLASWRHDTGLVCSPPAGCAPEGVWAELECAFLNGHQARWQYAADTAGFGFAQGKTMLWRRDDLDRAGGLRILGHEAAEDAMATKVVRAQGLRVRLADAPFGQPLGRRSAREVFSRQLRWARLRRASFPLCFAPEILSGGLLPLLALLAAAALAGQPLALAALLFVAFWYGAETMLVRAAGWPLSWRTPLIAMLRDLVLPALWVGAWTGSTFVWRGNAMHAVESARPS